MLPVNGQLNAKAEGVMEYYNQKKKWKSWQETWNTAKWRDVKLAEDRGSCRNTPFEWAAEMLMIL